MSIFDEQENWHLNEVEEFLAKLKRAEELKRLEEERMVKKLREAAERIQAEDNRLLEQMKARSEAEQRKMDGILEDWKARQEAEQRKMDDLLISRPNTKPIILGKHDTAIYSKNPSLNNFFIEAPRSMIDFYNDLLGQVRQTDQQQMEQALAKAQEYAERGRYMSMECAIMTAQMHAKNAGEDVGDRITAIEQTYTETTGMIPTGRFSSLFIQKPDKLYFEPKQPRDKFRIRLDEL